MSAETVAADLHAAVIRLEGKVDALASKVDYGDRQSEQLVDLLKLRLEHVATSLEDIKAQITNTSVQADKATSAVRVDLERQLQARTAEGERIHAEIQKDIDAQGETNRRVFARLEKVDASVNRLYGGLGVVAALGVPGVVALIKGFG